MDELSTSASTRVVEVDDGRIERYAVAPEELGLERAPDGAIVGGDPAANAATTRAIFAGERGPARDLAVLNGGAAIYAGGRADTLRQGVRLAERTLDDGAALDALERFVARTHERATATP